MAPKGAGRARPAGSEGPPRWQRVDTQVSRKPCKRATFSAAALVRCGHAMTTTATKSQLVKARVAPDLVERFTLAARLDGRTVSDALRCAMSAYVRAVAQHDDGPG